MSDNAKQLSPSAAPTIESRGVVLYPSAGASRAEIAQTLERCSRAGFNFIVLKVFAGGRFFGSCEAWAGTAGRRGASDPDSSGRIIEIARMLDLPVYAGFELLETRERAGARNELIRQRPDWFIPEEWEPGEKLARAELSSPSAQERFGSVRWLCPFHPDARRFLGDLLVETLESEAFEGLYLDSLALPAALDAPKPRDFFPTAALWKKWKARLAEEGELPEGGAEAIGPEEWNAWLSDEVVGFINYLRARVYKVRAHLTMMAETRPPASAPADSQEEAARHLSLDWTQALDFVLDMLAPAYGVGPSTALDSLGEDLEALGDEAPLVPLLRLQEDKIPSAPFRELRSSSVFGFMVDAGRALSEKQWDRLEKINGPARAMCAHREPAAALKILQAETLALLPPGHELAEFLQAMASLLATAEDERQEEARLNFVRNLKGLLRERRSKLKLPPAAESKVLRNLGLMIRLHAMLASRGQMLKATPYHFS